MKILIVYGTTEGQTRKIARFIENILKEKGHEVTLADASDEPPVPMGFDAIVIGGSLHMHQHQSSVRDYVTRHVNELNKMPGAFFSVCLAVVSDLEDEHREAEKISAEFLSQTNWKPTMSTLVAGALKYTEYDFLKRLIMKMISKRENRPTDTSRDYEYTDWEAVKKFVLEFESKIVK